MTATTKKTPKRKPYSQVRLKPRVFRLLQRLAQKTSRSAPLQAEQLILDAAAAAGVS